jgi:hypothetical protein
LLQRQDHRLSFGFSKENERRANLIFWKTSPAAWRKVTRIFEEGRVSITRSRWPTSGFSICSDRQRQRNAQRLLKDHGYTVGVTEVVAVEVEDRPGGLHRILKALAKDNINVEYMYAFVRQSGHNAVLIFRFDDIPAASAVLKREGVRVIDGQDLYAM